MKEKIINPPRLNENYGKPNSHYMKRLEDVTRNALKDYARILAFRLDLSLPLHSCHQGYDSQVITRFIASLKAQIQAYQQKRRKQGKRVYPCRLRYAWVREFGEINGNKHYHLVILVNREVFHKASLIYQTLKKREGRLKMMVFRAWCRALKCHDNGRTAVSFHLPGVSYELNRRDGTDTLLYHQYLHHISYLAKEHTKHHDDGERNFGCSQG